MDEELQCLQSLGVIKLVQFSDWAEPISPRPQGRRRVRVCGDYKVTVNRAARQDKYPMKGKGILTCTQLYNQFFTQFSSSHPLQEVYSISIAYQSINISFYVFILLASMFLFFWPQDLEIL